MELAGDGARRWRRALDRQKEGAKLVVVDPLRTESADKADVHLAVRPGQDWALLLAMVKVILDEGLEHPQDCRDWPPACRSCADSLPTPTSTTSPRGATFPAGRSNRSPGNSLRPGAMVITRTGISLHLAGTIGEWLGHVLNVITGRMDRPGGTPLRTGLRRCPALADLAKPITTQAGCGP